MERFDDKLTIISDRLGSIDVTLAKQNIQLTEHIRRTAILEAEIKPIRKHVTVVQGVGASLGVISVILSILYRMGFL